MGNVVLLFFQRIEIYYLTGNFSVLNSYVGRFNYSEIIDLGISGKVEDKTDVRSFRSMNRANAAVVRRMHVAHLKSRSLAGEPSRPESGKCAQVFYLVEHVFLRHELGKLVGGEKFLDARLERTLVDYLYRHSGIHVDDGHAVLNIAFDLHHTGPDLLL